MKLTNTDNQTKFPDWDIVHVCYRNGSGSYKEMPENGGYRCTEYSNGCEYKEAFHQSLRNNKFNKISSSLYNKDGKYIFLINHNASNYYNYADGNYISHVSFDSYTHEITWKEGDGKGNLVPRCGFENKGKHDLYIILEEEIQ